MDARRNALEGLLLELTELGAAAEEKGISSQPPLAPLLARAAALGIALPANAGFDELRDAVEAACAAGNTDGAQGAADGQPVHAREILGNEQGIPGDGP